MKYETPTQIPDTNIDTGTHTNKHT